MISLVVCTYNRSGSLLKTLESIAQSTVPPDFFWELLIVDNNSTDNTRSLVEAFGKSVALNVRYLFEPKQGLSHARNCAIANAKGDLIVFTDDDVLVDPHWFEEVVKPFAEPECTAVGGKIIAVWNSKRPKWFSEHGPYALDKAIISFDMGNQDSDLQRAPFGANMAFRKEAFEKFGGFRTDLGRQGNDVMVGEDTELTRRMLKGGARFRYASRAIVYHPVEPQRATKKYFQTYYKSQGRFLARTYGFPAASVAYFGVPRFLFREFLIGMIRWLTSAGSKRRFYNKLQIYLCAGKIAEAYAMSARQRSFSDTITE